MAELRVFLLAGILTLFGAAPIGAQFTATGSSSSLQTTTGATGSAQAAPTAGTPASAGAADVVNESVVVMPCIPVAAYWVGAPLDDGMPSGPDLAIVSTQVRPKNARVYLDDRFVGRARYLDGKPGYFYLEPGAYRLELRFDGYRTVVVELDATAGCKFVVKHYLERVKGEPTKGKADGFGKGKPFDRVFSPMPEADESMAPATAHGPDPSLRLDLTLGSGRMGDTGTKTGASIRLQIDPMSASVSPISSRLRLGGSLKQPGTSSSRTVSPSSSLSPCPAQKQTDLYFSSGRVAVTRWRGIWPRSANSMNPGQ